MSILLTAEGGAVGTCDLASAVDLAEPTVSQMVARRSGSCGCRPPIPARRTVSRQNRTRSSWVRGRN
ncbi:hypothetical protein [Rhodococcus zopfii]|uniref:hypothetical protein n=1 Tax=Rhodococcus zopfii TaxID=43772 RepID=UPI00352822D3